MGFMGAYEIRGEPLPLPLKTKASPRRTRARAKTSVTTDSADMQGLIAKLPLFDGLDEKTIKRLAKGARELHVPRGRLLFAPGDACDGMYVIVSGRVKLGLPVQQHADKVVALLEPGAAFGETGIFLDEPRIMSAEALRDSTFVHLLGASLCSAVERDAVLARRLLAALSRRVRDLVTDMRRTTIESGTQRTVMFLLDQVGTTAGGGRATITLPAKKRLIASRLNLTGEHFSRILHELSSARLIRVEGPSITIPDVQRLRDYGAMQAAG